jgi:hypothetical protein
MSENQIYVLFLSVPLATGFLLFYYRSYSDVASWWRLVIGNGLMLCFLMSTLFVVAESYYRFFYDTTDSLSYTKVSQRWFKRHVVNNAAGFRDNIEYTPKIEPGKRRVTFLGDSFTFGHGVTNVDERFGNLIRATHPEWEINVIAFPGLETQQELELLKSGLNNGYQIDQVVLVYCLNDVADIFPEWRNAYQAIMADDNEKNWFRQHSYFMDIFYHHYKASHNPYINNYFHFVKKGYSGQLWEKQRRRLTALRDLVNSNGGTLMVVTFPFLHAVGPHYDFLAVHDEIKLFWDRIGVPNLDLLSAYSEFAPKKITVNRYDAHPNEFAHSVAAKKIDEFLKANMR